MELVAFYLAAGIIFGALTAGSVHREEIKYLREELKVAHAQIAHAVIQERAVIPERVEPPEPIEPLSKELQECVDQWDTVESRAVEEHKIRGWQAEGWDIKTILRQYVANP